jgi:7-cyano-7-deazaguanine synthase
MKVVLVYSGGLDSTVLLYHLQADGHEVQAVSVHYGQRHAQELDVARQIAASKGIEHKVVDLSPLGTLLTNSALASIQAEIPREEYSPQNMVVTTVPNRNMILLSVALAWAVRCGYDAVAFAAHSGLTCTYPDCRPQFARCMDEAAQVCDWRPLRVLAPFVSWTKGDIVRRGAALGVPFARTWSCYVGGSRHCGTCGTCRDRRQAFTAAGIPDPTDYD